MEVVAQIVGGNIDPGWMLDGVMIIAFILAGMQLKDIKADLKEIKVLLTDHDRQLVKINTKLKIEDGE